MTISTGIIPYIDDSRDHQARLLREYLASLPQAIALIMRKCYLVDALLLDYSHDRYKIPMQANTFSSEVATKLGTILW